MANSSTHCKTSLCSLVSSMAEKDFTVNIVAQERPKENNINDQLRVVVRVSTSLYILTPVSKLTIYHSSKKKTFEHSNEAFLSVPEADQRNILYNMIQSSDIPFPLENLYWGRRWLPKIFINLVEVMDRLLTATRDSAEKKTNLQIEIHNQQSLRDKRFHEAKQTLDDWFEKNKNCRDWVGCFQVIHDNSFTTLQEGVLYVVSRRLTTMRKEIRDGDEDCCPICINELEKGWLIMGMSCSHVFHGSCIFQWFLVNPTCPICRFKLLKKAKGKNETSAHFEIP